MIPVTHRAFHLFREDAYREYCWSVDAYGSYQPASFIYLCYEGFYELCAKQGIQLNWPAKLGEDEHKEFQEFPQKCERESTIAESFGLITRLYNVDQVPEIETNLKNGKNVICLFPGEEISLFYNGDKEKFSKAEKAFNKINCDIISKSFFKTTNATDKVEWEEIPTNYTGKLFVTKDSYLSDGFFKDKYGKTEENSKRICTLIQEFSIFKYAFLSIVPQQNILIWPCNEPYQMTYRIINHGISLTNVKMHLEINESFEPISPTERVITISSADEIDIPIAFIPRSIISNVEPVKFLALNQENEPVLTYENKFSISISSNYLSKIEEQSIQDNNKFEKLLKTFEGNENYAELEKISQLIKVDINSCLNKLRSVAEMITQSLLEKKKIYTNKGFSDSIRLLQYRKLLSSRAIGYLHTVRVIGNLASHPSGNKLTETDVLIASFALASVMEEVIAKYKL